MKTKALLVLVLTAGLSFATTLNAQIPSQQIGETPDASDVRPPVTQDDVRIVQRARRILSSPSKWNRADTRVRPAEAKRYSLYCALEKATTEVSGDFQHRARRCRKRGS